MTLNEMKVIAENVPYAYCALCKSVAGLWPSDRL